MIPTSSDFKEQLKNSRGAWHELIRITLQNNTELVLTDENIWSGGFRINDAVSSEDSFSVLGSAIINQANLTINNIQGQYSQYDFLFAKVELYIGLYVEKTVAYIKNREAKYILDRVGDRLVARVGAMELLKKGEWTVVSQPDIANASLIDLELYDGMYKLDKTYDSTLTFPSTIGNVVSDICTHCGVTLQSATFPNYNITIQTRPDLADTTYREVLAYMCQLSGNYARFNAAGNLELKWIDTDALDHATDVISGGTGGYVVIGRNADGQPNELYIMDSPDMGTAVNVLRMNYAGIAFSNTGINGTYTTAWTIVGSPLTTVAIPLWITANGKLPDVVTHQQGNASKRGLKSSSSKIFD